MSKINATETCSESQLRSYKTTGKLLTDYVSGSSKIRLIIISYDSYQLIAIHVYGRRRPEPRHSSNITHDKAPVINVISCR